MNNQQFVILSKDNIEEKIEEYLINGSSYHYHSKIECSSIKDSVKDIWKETKYSFPGTYVYLGQSPSAFLYGLYKRENGNIYIIKSFMETIIHAVPFNKKYFE